MEKRWIWPFELEEQIGSGAMGVVYRARFVKNDRRVALKLLPKEVAANATLAARFQREMEILKDLRHSHIVHCFGGTCEGDQWFYAMELIDGGSLHGLLVEQGKLPWRKVIEFSQQICAALEHAHARGVIHRDLKPGNLLLSKGGKIKLADFGLALVSAETRLTSAGKTLGSIHYMAPEQIQGKPPLSNRTDLYALGCVMHELLCGRPPFTGEAMAEILQQHLKQLPPRISTLALDCPKELEEIISDLLEKSPEGRPGSAAEIAQRLQKIDRDISVRAPRFDRNVPVITAPTRTVTAVESPDESRTWNKPLTIALVAALAICAWLFSSRLHTARLYALSEKQFVAALQDTTQPQPIRLFAAHSLGELGRGAQTAIEPLLAMLTDADPAIRAEAAKSIGKIGDGDAYLIAQLRKMQERDEQPMAREAIGEAVKELVKAPGGSSLPLVLGLGTLLFAGGAGFWLWRQVKA
ncbi:MAG TPA: protein kinase [Planctomycetaceae bacterium]